MKAFSVMNIIQGNGIAISITGMAIVFSGLIIISVFIQLLPKVIILLEKKPKSEEAPVEDSVTSVAKTEADEAPQEAAENGDEAGDKDIASLIGLILHLENERLYQSDQQYITIHRDPSQPSRWGRTGNMRELPHRRSYAKV